MTSTSRTALASFLFLVAAVTGAEGEITFAVAVDYAAATDPSGVVVADFNGDGLPDVAVTRDGPDRVSIFSNTGAGALGTPADVVLAGGSGPHSLAAVDIDGDEDVDLVVTRTNENDVQILANAGGTFSLGATTAVAGSEPRQLAAADLDGNGLADVVTVNRDSGDVSVLLNTAGVLGAPAVHGVGADPRGLALADLDGDQLIDIAVSSHDDRSIDLLLNLEVSPGVFASGPSVSLGSELRSEGVTAADLDGDEVVDLAAATSGDGGNFASVFLGLGAAVFSARVDYPTAGLDPSAILAADLDHDGRLDLAVTNQSSANVAVLSGTGGGAFGGALLLAVGTTPEALAGGDLSGNGVADLVALNRDSGSVSVLANTSAILVDGFDSGDTGMWTAVGLP